jgi:hypothetical protein
VKLSASTFAKELLEKSFLKVAIVIFNAMAYFKADGATQDDLKSALVIVTVAWMI